MLRSVRARITAAAAVVVAVVLVVMSVLVVLSQRSALTEQLDDALELEAERLAGAAEAGRMPVLDDDDLLVVVLRDGELVAATADMEGGVLGALARSDDGAVHLDGEPHRVVRAEEGDVEVAVAASAEEIDESVGGLVRTLGVLVPLATALLAAVVWVLVGRTLRPVERIRAEVAAIGLEALDRRVPQPAGGDEIARLASTMNEMLERLDRANQRQQRFVADASHELRTPLTRIRAELELDGRHPDRADPEATRRSVLRDVAALQRLIDDLLLLARSDAAPTPPSALVDLDDLVLEEAAAFGGIDVRNVSAAQVRGDASALRRVVRNLFDNATRHAAGRVEVRLGEEAGRAVLTVDDDGEGIPAARRAEVFQRFARLDDARTPTEGRTGLGLAIVQTVVAQHGGTVEAGDSPLGGARFTVSLPLHRA